MFDPTAMLLDTKYGYICVHTGADYRNVPRRILWNPLRWQIGIGKGRPCRWVINNNGAANRKLSNLIYAAKQWLSGSSSSR